MPSEWLARPAGPTTLPVRISLFVLDQLLKGGSLGGGGRGSIVGGGSRATRGKIGARIVKYHFPRQILQVCCVLDIKISECSASVSVCPVPEVF